MPRMDKTGPDGLGNKLGRKLGRCRQSDNDTDDKGTLGVGLGRKRHSESKGLSGKGKRLRYFENKDLLSE